MSILDTKIEFLKGVGPRRATLLNTELNIFYFRDLLYFFPYRYVDRTKIYHINKINSFDIDVQILGVVRNKKILGLGKKKRLIVDLFDQTGTVQLTFFRRISWLNRFLIVGAKYLIFGRPSTYANKISFVHPEIDLMNDSKLQTRYSLYPMYHSTDKLNSVGLNSKGISKLVYHLLSAVNANIMENFSQSIIAQYNFLSRSNSLSEIHFPSNHNMLSRAINRLKFEELFFLQLALLKQKIIRKNKFKSFVFHHVGEKFNSFYHNHLSFSLTKAQKRVMKEIRLDVLTGFQMNRLLQGDVGSGKTIIAIMSILLAHDNGFQSCLMAPTAILANQHFYNIMKFANAINLRVSLLTGKTKKSDKKQIIVDLKHNKIDLIIGTHALIEDDIKFNQLGLVIIDEQHKFGVSQRAKLWTNKKIVPHVLVMTATPIPRTLAMTAYGNLDVSVINELPPGRKPVLTLHKYDKEINQVYHFLNKELENGKQIYIVYPLIEESKVLDYKNLLEGYRNIQDIFLKKGFKTSMIHGRLNKEDKEREMENFLNKNTHIMVSTTVIEVGVDVPNATVMVIQNSEKFGLSQLHQLRGRVGRGSDQSYCYLVTSHKLTSDAKIRIKAMVNSTDGFHIAEVDLKLRGPGDILGTRQSGLVKLKLSSLIKDFSMLSLAREKAKKILNEDFNLSKPSNSNIRQFFLKYHSQLLKWGSVS